MDFAMNLKGNRILARTGKCSIVSLFADCYCNLKELIPSTLITIL